MFYYINNNYYLWQAIEINNNLVEMIYPFLSEVEGYCGSIFLGFVFIFVGFLFKISSAPFHN